MRKDLEKLPTESNLEWANRLNDLVLNAGGPREADTELVDAWYGTVQVVFVHMNLRRATEKAEKIQKAATIVTPWPSVPPQYSGGRLRGD